ncbi:MAG: hypothetical protein ACRBCS_03055 [Cellvibrionaceae bacterium]
MSNVIQIKPCGNAAHALRNIADMIDNEELCNECTVIVGSEVFHCGEIDDGRAAESAIFNMTFGIQKLMRPVVDAVLDQP